MLAFLGLRSTKLLDSLCSWRRHRNQRATPALRGDQLVAEADKDDVAEVEGVMTGVVGITGAAVAVLAIVDAVAISA